MPEALRVVQRWAVEGGPLKKPWLISRVVDCDGKHFVELKTTDVGLSQFCDRPSKQCVPLLDVLRQLRNQAVDEAVLEQLKENDPIGTYERAPPNWRNLVDPPETVNVVLQAFNSPDGVQDGCEMTLLFEEHKTKPVAMELTPDNLTYLRSASMAFSAGSLSAEAFGNCRKRRRRLEGERILLDTPIVKCAYQDRSMYVEWTNADGKKARHFKKPASWNMEEIRAAESDLLRWRLERHHVMNDDGVYELEHIRSEDDDGVDDDDDGNDNDDGNGDDGNDNGNGDDDNDDDNDIAELGG